MTNSKSLPTFGFALARAAFTFGLAVCTQAQTATFFDFNSKNGWEPYGSVTQATDGNFYGTGSGGIYGGGNIFRMTPTEDIPALILRRPSYGCRTSFSRYPDRRRRTCVISRWG